MNRWLSLGAALAVALGITGCGASAGDTLRANTRIVREETSRERLAARGDAYASVGDTLRAEQYFAAALAAGAPPEVMIRRILRACAADRRYRVAIEHGETYLRHHDRDADVRGAVAALYEAIGEPYRAREHFEAALQERPRDADLHFGLATLLRRDLHDAVGADLHFRAYLAVAPSGEHADEARVSLLRPVHR